MEPPRQKILPLAEDEVQRGEQGDQRAEKAVSDAEKNADIATNATIRMMVIILSSSMGGTINSTFCIVFFAGPANGCTQPAYWLFYHIPGANAIALQCPTGILRRFYPEYPREKTRPPPHKGTASCL